MPVDTDLFLDENAAALSRVLEAMSNEPHEPRTVYPMGHVPAGSLLGVMENELLNIALRDAPAEVRKVDMGSLLLFYFRFVFSIGREYEQKQQRAASRKRKRR